MVTYEERQEYQYHLEKKLFKSARKRGHNNLKSIGCQLSTRHVYMCVSMYIIWLYIYIFQSSLKSSGLGLICVYIYIYILLLFFLLFIIYSCIYLFIYLFIYLLFLFFWFIYLFNYLIYLLCVIIDLQACKPACSTRRQGMWPCFDAISSISSLFRLSPTLLSGPHSTCFCHVPEHGTPQVESIWEWIWPTHRILSTKTDDSCGSVSKPIVPL